MVGAFLLGYTDGMTYRDIAPCGLNCALCYARQRDKNRCPGCNGDDGEMPTSCRSCSIRPCDARKTAIGSARRFCDSCESFPCKRLKALQKRYREKYGADLRANLAAIRERGIRAFLVGEKKAWACPECGETLCMHKAECPSCGARNPRYIGTKGARA